MSARSAAAAETLVFLAVATGLFAVEQLVAVPPLFEGLGPICLLTLAVVLMVRRRGEGWGVLGIQRPARLRTLPLWFLGLFAAFYVLNMAAMALVQSGLLDAPDLSKFEPVRGNVMLLLVGLAIIWVTAAFFEEIVFRGFLLDRLLRLTGTGRAAALFAIVAQAMIFGALHFYQGITGILFTAAAGALFALFYILQGRNIWVQVAVHGLVDTIGLVHFFLGGVPE